MVQPFVIHDVYMNKSGYPFHGAVGAALGFLVALAAAMRRSDGDQFMSFGRSFIEIALLTAPVGAATAVAAFSLRRFRMRGIVSHYLSWIGAGGVAAVLVLLIGVRARSEIVPNILFGCWFGGSLGFALGAIERRLRRPRGEQ